MKYIGGLSCYICNIVFMFGLNNIDEFYVQETCIEIGKTRVSVSGESSSNKDGKGKGNGKKENIATIKEDKISCKHYKKEGHDDEN
jgi:hypothetical protein